MLKEERRFFFPVGFIFAVTSWHAHQNLTAGKCALATSPPKHLFCAESFGGRVLLRITMLAEQYVPFKKLMSAYYLIVV